jgi:hypothetical protein
MGEAVGRERSVMKSGRRKLEEQGREDAVLYSLVERLPMHDSDYLGACLQTYCTTAVASEGQDLCGRLELS